LRKGKKQEALDQISQEPPDLIVLDLLLPHIDGIHPCQILRKELTVPIIMLTDRDSVSDKVLGLEEVLNQEQSSFLRPSY
jgi:two-component system response regulator VicR